MERTGFEDDNHKAHGDRSAWKINRGKMAALIRKKTRDEWCGILEGTDVCFAPVLSISEAPLHPHNQARKTFTEEEGVVQPSPAPRFSRTPSKIQKAPSAVGADTRECLNEWGFDRKEIDELFSAGVVK